MTDTDPNEKPKPGDVANELHELGKNLASILQGAWESDERKKFTDEIRAGMEDLNHTLNQAVSDFRQSPTGQRMQDEVKEFKDRVRTGELDTKIREEILSALKTVNRELEKASKKNQTPNEPPVV